MRKQNSVFPSPAEPRYANLQVWCWERRRRDAERGEEFQYARLTDTRTGFDDPGDEVGGHFQEVEGFVEECCEPRGGLHDFVHQP